MGCERNRRVMGDAMVFLLSQWESGAAIIRHGEDCNISDMEREGSEVYDLGVNLECV